MRTLVLGGTAWLGSHIARAALERGATVTALARGTSGSVPDGVRHVIGDRSRPDAYAGVVGQRWDLVVDVGRDPRHVQGALAALGEQATHWVFVSTGSVYADHEALDRTEATALLPAYVGDDPGPADYGAAKVSCEQACARSRGADVLVARSGLIAGWGDPSDRVGYWPGRFALAAEDDGAVLVPERLDRASQVIDVRDLAGWLVEAGSAGSTGTVNAGGARTTLAELLGTAARVAGFEGPTVAVPDGALQGAGVESFMGERSLPMWIDDPAWQGFLSLDTTAAEHLGLRTRSLADTLTACLAWERHLGLRRTGRRAGLDRADELAVIAAR